MRSCHSNQQIVQPQGSPAASLVLPLPSSLTNANSVPLRVVTEIERKYADVGQEIIEELYVQEVMNALEECLMHVNNKNAQL